jgi:hypothetical protein
MHGELFGIAAAPSIAIGDAMVVAGRLKENWRMAPNGAPPQITPTTATSIVGHWSARQLVPSLRTTSYEKAGAQDSLSALRKSDFCPFKTAGSTARPSDRAANEPGGSGVGEFSKLVEAFQANPA